VYQGVTYILFGLRCLLKIIKSVYSSNLDEIRKATKDILKHL